jgi:flagellar biosynthesis/type III secretory pathway chaperone
MPQAAAPTTNPPIASPAEAHELIAHFSDVMDTLLGFVEEETRLVRNGKLTEVARLEARKADLARLYVADSQRLKASKPYLAQALPDLLSALRDRHDNFRALLQINLTVLATAHAVSEGIMRGVSEEITRKSAPQVYGASGRTATPNPRHAQPLTMSRVL